MRDARERVIVQVNDKQQQKKKDIKDVNKKRKKMKYE